MAPIRLTDKEHQLPVELLEREIPNLRHEIHHTDDSEYRAFLKERASSLETLLHNLKAQAEATVSQ